MDRLTQTSDKGGVAFTFDLDITCRPSEAQKILRLAEKLKSYEDAEEQGLLLKLPCKYGDTVYTACSWGIESGVVGSIEIISDRVFVNNIHGEMIGEANNIFLTREEAEQKLVDMKCK